MLSQTEGPPEVPFFTEPPGRRGGRWGRAVAVGSHTCGDLVGELHWEREGEEVLLLFVESCWCTQGSVGHRFVDVVSGCTQGSIGHRFVRVVSGWRFRRDHAGEAVEAVTRLRTDGVDVITVVVHVRVVVVNVLHV